MNFNLRNAPLMRSDFKRVLVNFYSLALLQGANYILPLITFPYLIRTLGIENFGLLAFATATVAYFGIVIDYGFNLSATREISLSRENKDTVSEIFSSVMLIKAGLALLSFVLLLVLLACFERLRSNASIYILSFGVVAGQMLFPVWFFQGMEQMKYVTYVNIAAKTIFVIAIFAFVSKSSDFYLVPVFSTIGLVVSGVASLFLVSRQFGIKFIVPTSSTIKRQLSAGWHVFISRVYVSIYTTTNVMVLGLLAGNAAVGFYSVAEKVIVAVAGLFEPANQALYPFLARKTKHHGLELLWFVKKAAAFFLVLAVPLAVATALLSSEITEIVYGKPDATISLLLSICAIRIVTYPFGPLLSNALIILDKKDELIRAMKITVILDFAVVIPATTFQGAIGMAAAFMFVLLLHVAALSYYLFRTPLRRGNV